MTIIRNCNRLASSVCLMILIVIMADFLNREIALARSPESKDQTFIKLRRIGEVVARAILNNDIELILRYDRGDLVKSDRDLLKNKESDLYCHLFNTDCITWGTRSVYDVINNASQLQIRIRELGKSNEGYPYAMILFYDAAIIDEDEIASPKFLCEKGGTEIVSWTFRFLRGTCESAHPPFDAETDVYCSPD